jgi:hypothetical protein
MEPVAGNYYPVNTFIALNGQQQQQQQQLLAPAANATAATAASSAAAAATTTKSASASASATGYTSTTSATVLTQLAVLTDRAQGGSSLHDGELELMVHRCSMNNMHRLVLVYIYTSTGTYTFNYSTASARYNNTQHTCDGRGVLVLFINAAGTWHGCVVHFVPRHCCMVPGVAI